MPDLCQIDRFATLHFLKKREASYNGCETAIIQDRRPVFKAEGGLLPLCGLSITLPNFASLLSADTLDAILGDSNKTVCFRHFSPEPGIQLTPDKQGGGGAAPVGPFQFAVLAQLRRRRLLLREDGTDPLGAHVGRLPGLPGELRQAEEAVGEVVHDAQGDGLADGPQALGEHHRVVQHGVHSARLRRAKETDMSGILMKA